jgi:hypothetical protein
MYLQPNEVKAIAKVNLELRPFVENKNSPKVFEAPVLEATQFIRDQVQISMHRGGLVDLTKQAAAITSVATGVYEYIVRSKYKHVTFAEMADAFLRGGAGEYDTDSRKLFGYGVDRFTQCIRFYMESASREHAMKKWISEIESPSTEKPVADLFKINLAICQNFFELFDPSTPKKYKSVYAHDSDVFHLPSLFDFLRSNYEFSISDAGQETILKTAKIEYNEYIKKSGLQKSDPGKWQTLVESVKLGTNVTFDFSVKTEALKYIFTKMKEKNKTLNDLKRR